MIDLSLIPLPGAVDTLDPEALLAERKQKFVADLAAMGVPFTLAQLESDPAVKLLELGAFVETLVRQTINDKVRAVYAPTAVGDDLDNLVARANVQRLVIEAATALTPAVMEKDGPLLTRYLQSFDLPSAGSEDAYKAIAAAAYPARRDVALINPQEGSSRVLIVLLSPNGEPVSPTVLTAVTKAAHAKSKRPLTDAPTAVNAIVVDYTARIVCSVPKDTNQAPLRTAIETALAAVVDSRFVIGRDVPLSALEAPGYFGAVTKVVATSPAADIPAQPRVAPRCTAFEVVFQET